MLPFTDMPSYLSDIIEDYCAGVVMEAVGGPHGGGRGETPLHPWQKAPVGGAPPRMAKNLSERLLKCPACGVQLPLSDSAAYFDHYAIIANHSLNHDPPVKGAWLDVVKKTKRYSPGGISGELA